MEIPQYRIPFTSPKSILIFKSNSLLLPLDFSPPIFEDNKKALKGDFCFRESLKLTVTLEGVLSTLHLS
jgi:hypothetical protein